MCLSVYVSDWWHLLLGVFDKICGQNIERFPGDYKWVNSLNLALSLTHSTCLSQSMSILLSHSLLFSVKYSRSLFTVCGRCIISHLAHKSLGKYHPEPGTLQGPNTSHKDSAYKMCEDMHGVCVEVKPCDVFARLHTKWAMAVITVSAQPSCLGRVQPNISHA